MNKNIVAVAFVLIAGTTGYLLTSSDTPTKRDHGQPSIIPYQETELAIRRLREHAAMEDQKRRAAMRAEYAELEQARDKVRRQLGLLKSRVWKLQLPPDQVWAIRKQMQQGYAILKNPLMLGAFSSVHSIRQEIARVNVTGNRLETLEMTVQEYITAQNPR